MGDVGAMARFRAERNVAAADPPAEGQILRTLIGAIGHLGYLVRHVFAGTGPGSWQRFDSERSLAEYLRLTGFAEVEVQGALRILANGDRVELARPGNPGAAAPELAVLTE